MIWFTADNHFGHENIIKYCNRPFKNRLEMDDVMIQRWNQKVKNSDTIYHLGDLLFDKYVDLHGALNGNIILIKGNHDKRMGKLRKMGITIYKKPLEITLNGKRFNLMHAPLYRKGYAINLCGHVHDKHKIINGCINVGVDVRDFYPVSIDDIIEEAKQMAVERVDYESEDDYQQALQAERDEWQRDEAEAQANEEMLNLMERGNEIEKKREDELPF